jgi:MurNAc alpha-1-phosphate uridylyltransferase
MLFAAGFGTRMRPLTEALPKPLIPVAGRPLIDRALDLARGAGAGPIVVNTHYRGAQIAAHLAGAADVAISDEPGEILETGGGLRQALPLLGEGPVMTLNPDAVWRGANPLAALAGAWDADRMDALLLVQEAGRVRGRGGRADFTRAPDGRLARARDGEAGVVYLGAQILRTGGLAQVPERVFSLNRLWDRMIAEGRLYGLPYAGDWCDVGSLEGLAEAEAMLAGGGRGDVH